MNFEDRNLKKIIQEFKSYLLSGVNGINDCLGIDDSDSISDSSSLNESSDSINDTLSSSWSWIYDDRPDISENNSE